MCEEEGGGCVELIPGGRELEVTAHNVYDYVRKYSQHRMLISQEKALEVSNIQLTCVVSHCHVIQYSTYFCFI